MMRSSGASWPASQPLRIMLRCRYWICGVEKPYMDKQCGSEEDMIFAELDKWHSQVPSCDPGTIYYHYLGYSIEIAPGPPASDSGFLGLQLLSVSRNH